MTTNNILAETSSYLTMVPAVMDGAVTITLAEVPQQPNLTRVCAHSSLDSFEDRCTIIPTPNTAQELVAAAASAVDVQLAHACMWEDEGLTVETVNELSGISDEDLTAAWYWLDSISPEQAVSVCVTATPSGGIESIRLYEPGDEEGQRIRLRTYDRLPVLLRERQDDWEANQAESL